MRRLWAQIAAMGVGQIILTNAERVERNYFDTHVLMPECYRPLLVEGLQQARDTRLPRVSIHRQFKVLVEDELDRLFPSGLRPGQSGRPGGVNVGIGRARAHPTGRRVLLATVRARKARWNARKACSLRWLHHAREHGPADAPCHLHVHRAAALAHDAGGRRGRPPYDNAGRPP
jgi:hypothetical protein